MTLIVLACLWVLAATVVAFLPMRYQNLPGGALLLAAPVLLVMIAREVNPWLALAGVAAVISMFRRPLLYHIRRLMGRLPSDPKEPGA